MVYLVGAIVTLIADAYESAGTHVGIAYNALSVTCT